LRTAAEKFHQAGVPRNAVLRQLEAEAHKYTDSKDRVLLSFTSDPYQPAEDHYKMTRGAIRILTDHSVPWQVLTKGGVRACRDFDIFIAGGGYFATSLVFTEDSSRREWEPAAASVESRLEAIRQAHEAGIRTWVSVEPVIDPKQALSLIENNSGIVDAWKIGKLNHHPAAAQVDWQKFTDSLVELLPGLPSQYMIKDSLRKYLPPGFEVNTICEPESTKSTIATLF